MSGGGPFDPPDPDFDPSIFSNGEVVVSGDSADYSERVSAVARVADVRVYAQALTDAQIDKIHRDSTWPSGKRMRQCADMSDDDFFDSVMWLRVQGVRGQDLRQIQGIRHTWSCAEMSEDGFFELVPRRAWHRPHLS